MGKREAFESYPDGMPNTCWTGPTLADGRLFVRNTYGDIACIDMSK